MGITSGLCAISTVFLSLHACNTSIESALSAVLPSASNGLIEFLSKNWPVVGITSLIWGVVLGVVVRACHRQKRLLQKKADDRAHEMYRLNVILEEKQEEISMQNEQLHHHRENLEKLVSERTEQMQRAVKKAEDADRLKSAFLANMSHEIRTPMNAIVGFASLLNSEDIDELERKEFNEIITNNCNALMVLINDILEISLIEANQLHLQKEKFDIHPILSELEYYFRMNNSKNLEIVFDNQGEGSLEMVSDPIRFRQIFTNLLNNAYKFTEAGSIHFGYEPGEKGTKFYVKDTGIGIDETEYENIFNYFHKLEKNNNQYYRGAGIGLSISNKLIEMMGGRIWLHSRRGEGSIFQFHISGSETYTPPVSKLANSQLQGRSAALKNRTVLVAEDDSTNFFLIEKILTREKMQVVWAKNGHEAVDYVKTNRPAPQELIVLMDIKMPRMNGINAAKEIARLCPEIPIIAVTAYAQQSNKRDLLEKNFSDYIAKPLRPKTLIDVLERHVQVSLES